MMPTERTPIILLIEDNPLTLQTLIEYLNKMKLTTTVAHNGEEALRRISTEPPDLILLDIMLPGMDGFEIGKLLKDKPTTRDVPIIFLTALTDTESKVKAYEAGGVDYITKPFDFREVAARVNMRLTLQRLQRRLKTQYWVLDSGEGRKKQHQDITILVVDDQALTLEALKAYLGTFGFTVLTARNGDAIVQAFPQPAPDLILLDVMMPGRDGYETCRWLKGNPATRDIPVIFMTSLTDMADKVKAFEVGGSDYIMKPYQYAEILNRINTHLTIQTLQRRLQKA
jgi:DNA-binding response OmpR family regulator